MPDYIDWAMRKVKPIDRLTPVQLRHFLDLFNREDLRRLAKTYDIPQRSLKRQLVNNIVYHRAKLSNIQIMGVLI